MHVPELNNQLFVITGGPGSGKTSLIQALENEGLITSKESGRKIIQDQLVKKGNALPWIDPFGFAELMFKEEISNYALALQIGKQVLFDRGIPDIVGYLKLSKLYVPHYMRRAVQNYRYNRHVFVTPPWPEIYRQDEERKQTLAEAIDTYHIMVKTYAYYNYKAVSIPLLSVNDRVGFIMDHLQKSKK